MLDSTHELSKSMEKKLFEFVLLARLMKLTVRRQVTLCECMMTTYNISELLKQSTKNDMHEYTIF